MTDHMKAAIEAGKLALCKHYNEWEDGQIVWESQADIQEEINEFTDAAESALYAMIPHLRAMIAQEILSGTNTFIVPPTVRYHDFKSGHATARIDAARIAKGPQQ